MFSNGAKMCVRMQLCCLNYSSIIQISTWLQFEFTASYVITSLTSTRQLNFTFERLLNAARFENCFSHIILTNSCAFNAFLSAIERQKKRNSKEKILFIVFGGNLKILNANFLLTRRRVWRVLASGFWVRTRKSWWGKHEDFLSLANFWLSLASKFFSHFFFSLLKARWKSMNFSHHQKKFFFHFRLHSNTISTSYRRLLSSCINCLSICM